MKVKATLSEIPPKATSSEPNIFKVEVLAIGGEWDANQFLKHIAKYEQYKQKDFTEEYYKSTTAD